MKRNAMFTLLLLVAFTLIGVITVSAEEKFDNDPKHQLPRPDNKPADMTRPVKVFILLGQSNPPPPGEPLPFSPPQQRNSHT